ncbi:unnamed protein product [Phytophthora fragariaefolia]|uniref:Unnamed protein product n=1 Tax=Phytophthora fragariaefolia TaxID=1490495 RepID=A0A9W6XKD0_9STRA|nr:unnamed protein product [Phytophthora fragariaefolia]
MPPIIAKGLNDLARYVNSTAVPVNPHPTLRILLSRMTIEDGLIYLHSNTNETRRLCVPNQVDLRNSILFEFHDSAAQGHPGSKKTLAIAQRKFYWLNMHKTVNKYVQSCELCQRIKASQRKTAGLFHPLEIPSKRWQHISMDFMPDLTASAKDTAKRFLREHVRLHGFPGCIVSDREPRFLSQFCKQLVASRGTQLRASTAFKPSTDGQNERSHRFINDYLRAFMSPRQHNWDELLPMAEFAYNSRPHSSIGMSPFEADLGYLLRAVDDLAVRGQFTAGDVGLRFSEHLQSVRLQCRDTLANAQGKMKHFYDRNRPDFPICVGDQVLLDTTHLDLGHVGTQGRPKFATRYIGPYKVIAATTPDTFKISLPPGIRLHDEFHVSYLRRYIEDTNPNRLYVAPRLLASDGAEGLQVRAGVADGGVACRRAERGDVVPVHLEAHLPSSLGGA